MIGAIVGDIVGSRFEFKDNKSKQFELFADGCRVTDDSVMTIAVAKAIMETEKAKRDNLNNNDDETLEQMAIHWMQQLGRKYPNSGFGGMFYKWVFSDEPKPYNSFGNGAAMRISPVGFVAKSEEEVRHLSNIITGVTHNHPEGLKGAEAVAMAVFMAKNGASTDEIKRKIERDYYSLDFTIDDIRDTYTFDVTCQGSVPQALRAFLESTTFEDAIRTAISIGGDADTIGAMTGSIAEAYYGVPEEIKIKALSYLNEEFLSIYNEWYDFLEKNK